MGTYTYFITHTHTHTLQAYNIARMLFDVANQLSESQEEVTLLSMIYPSDCHPDDNPAFILCRSDTCSFTWTGEEHIHQVSHFNSHRI